MSQLSYDVLKNLGENILKNFPGVSDFIHDFTEHLQTEIHVEDNLRVISKNLILIDHLTVHSLVKNTLLLLALNVFNTLL